MEVIEGSALPFLAYCSGDILQFRYQILCYFTTDDQCQMNFLLQGLEWCLNHNINQKTQGLSNWLRGVCCCLLSAAIAAGHNFVTQSHANLHLLTSTKSTSHENVLNKFVIRNVNEANWQCSKLLVQSMPPSLIGCTGEMSQRVTDHSCYSEFACIDGDVATAQISHSIKGYVWEEQNYILL
jgi:hypothetical protein